LGKIRKLFLKNSPFQGHKNILFRLKKQHGF